MSKGQADFCHKATGKRNEAGSQAFHPNQNRTWAARAPAAKAAGTDTLNPNNINPGTVSPGREPAPGGVRAGDPFVPPGACRALPGEGWS